MNEGEVVRVSREIRPCATSTTAVFFRQFIQSSIIDDFPCYLMSRRMLLDVPTFPLPCLRGSKKESEQFDSLKIINFRFGGHFKYGIT